MSNIYRVRKAIPQKIARKLWVSAGGRCEYKGCNTNLQLDSITKTAINKAYISHIIAQSSKGPRGNIEKSKINETRYSNLMLLCDECHNRIDKSQVKRHPVEILRKMKEEHENRIELLISLKAEQRTNIVIYGTNIGTISAHINFNDAIQTVLPEKYPSNNKAIELNIQNSLLYDSETKYWDFERDNVVAQFKEKINPIIKGGGVKHFSVFGFAPQPLLILLGTLFSDILDVDVYQKHREPVTWTWQNNSSFSDFILKPPKKFNGKPVLNLSLSATIKNNRINKRLGEKVSIWTLTHKKPNNNFLTTKDILSKFRNKCRESFDRIKREHGQDSILNIFPAMPISAAIELGRVWMPKADLKMVLYDQNSKKDGFIKTIDIPGDKHENR